MTRAVQTNFFTLDVSEIAEQALRHAIHLVRCLQAELFILRVMDPLTISYLGGSASSSLSESAENEVQSVITD